MDINGIFEIKISNPIEIEDRDFLVKYYSNIVNCKLNPYSINYSDGTTLFRGMEFVVVQNDLNSISYERKLEEIINKLEALPGVSVTRFDSPIR